MTKGATLQLINSSLVSMYSVYQLSTNKGKLPFHHVELVLLEGTANSDPSQQGFRRKAHNNKRFFTQYIIWVY